jgi:caffeoyl-CoA O-methyltransferase
MFNSIPSSIRKRMTYLEDLDKNHRAENLPADIRLRQVPRETGKFLSIMASLAPSGEYLEIGTSGGYSALWLALACREQGRRLITFEILPQKASIARETFQSAEVEDIVEVIQGDAREYLDNYRNISFCFLDAEKEMYAECYEKVVPNMISGGILVADNVISHKDVLKDMVEHALRDQRVDSVVVPIGNGLLLSVKR